MTKSELIKDLNPAQQKAVETTDGPILIIAGAGSGKTRVLTRKIAYLIEKGINPEYKGGLSGLPTKKKSNEILKQIYKKTKGKYVLVGVGGIFNAEDAYEKIKNGASLVQLITGMIYEGPGLIKKINKGLVKLLEKDGFSNISEAIGKNVK